MTDPISDEDLKFVEETTDSHDSWVSYDNVMGMIARIRAAEHDLKACREAAVQPVVPREPTLPSKEFFKACMKLDLNNEFSWRSHWRQVYMLAVADAAPTTAGQRELIECAILVVTHYEDEGKHSGILLNKLRRAVHAYQSEG